MRILNGEVSWRSDPDCGVGDGCSGEELVDALNIRISRIFEKDYLKQYIGIEKFYKQKYYQQDVCSRLDSCAEVAKEKNSPYDSLPEEAGYVPGQGCKHAQHSRHKVKNQRVSDDANCLNFNIFTSLVSIKPPKQCKMLG